jgi:uncharacterized membrane protein YgcG
VLGGYVVLRVDHGLGSDRPVGLLVMLMLLVACAAFIAWRRPVGANAVGRERVEAARVRLDAPRNVGATDPMLPMHLALLGSTGLVAASVVALREVLKPAFDANSRGWGGGSGGGNSGSGGDGGGGGCGGGGG